MKKSIVIIGIIFMLAGCKKAQTEKVKGYMYKESEKVNLPLQNHKAYIEEVFQDSVHPLIVTMTPYTPNTKSLGFVGYVWDGSKIQDKLWGVDTTKERSFLRVALQYYRNFYKLDDVLHNKLQEYNSPISTYILYQIDSLPPDSLYSYATNNINNFDKFDEQDAYFMVKIAYELYSKNKANSALMDSVFSLYLKRYPYGEYSPRIYYFLLSSGKIKKDTAINQLMEVAIKHKDDPFAERLIPVFADTTLKGNKKRKYMKEYLKKVKKLPATSLILQLSFYFPDMFKYIDESDTQNIYWRNLKENFTSPPYLIKLWTESELVTYHFAKGYYLKENNKFEKAIKEFNLCDNYKLPHYLIAEKDRQILDIYKKLGEEKSPQAEKVAFHLLSLNPLDKTARDALSNMGVKNIEDTLRKILKNRSWPVKGNVQFSLLDGKTLKVSDLKGKAWVIKFWSVYCPHCRKEIPYENQLADELKGQEDIGLLGCSTNSKEEVEEFIKNKPFKFTLAYNCNGLRKYFPVSGVPAYFVLDKNANVVFSHIGESPDIKGRLKKELEIAKKL